MTAVLCFCFAAEVREEETTIKIKNTTDNLNLEIQNTSEKMSLFA